MNNNIGELFKTLGKNEIFSNYVMEIDNGKNNKEIIDIALNDEALMCTLTMIVSDIEIIKNKMDIIIGQKRKSYEKKNNETKVNETKVNETDLNETDLNETIEFKYQPINIENVIWLNSNSYLERVDYKMRLVTTDYEIYY